MSRYPRTCKGRAGPHVINGPEDERPDGKCRECDNGAKREYNKSAKGKSSKARYRSTENAQEVEREGSKRWSQTPSGRESKQASSLRYAHSERGEANRKKNARRRTESGRGAEAQARVNFRKAEARDDQLMRELHGV